MKKKLSQSTFCLPTHDLECKDWNTWNYIFYLIFLILLLLLFFFFFILRMLVVLRFCQYSINVQTENYEVVRTWKESIMTLPWYLPRQTDETMSTTNYDSWCYGQDWKTGIPLKFCLQCGMGMKIGLQHYRKNIKLWVF